MGGSVALFGAGDWTRNGTEIRDVSQGPRGTKPTQGTTAARQNKQGQNPGGFCVALFVSYFFVAWTTDDERRDVRSAGMVHCTTAAGASGECEARELQVRVLTGE